MIRKIFSRMVLVVLICTNGVAFASSDRPVFAVSLVRLLIEPQSHEDRSVEVVGYLKGGANLRLYLSKELADASDSMSSILVSDSDNGDISSSKCLTSMVRISGVLVRSDPNSFVLARIKSIRHANSNAPCWSAK